LRAGEISVPSRGPVDPLSIVRICDIAFSHLPGSPYATLMIRRTKTSPHGNLVVIGCSGHFVCAYCSLLAYLTKVGVLCTSGVASPLLVLANGRVLHKDVFVSHTKSLVASIGLDPSKYSGHSYRAGSATTAAQSHFAEWEVKQLGHWASSTYQRYLHPSNLHVSQFAARLATDS
jgi:hypothetical protein